MITSDRPEVGASSVGGASVSRVYSLAFDVEIEDY